MHLNRTVSKALLAVVLMLVVLSNVADLAAAPVLIVDDAVEPSDGWTIVGGTFGDGFGLTSPIEGANLYNLADVPAESATKSFSGVLLAPGDYSAVFWVHNYSNNPSPPPGLAASLQANGVNIGDLLTNATIPLPAQGAWIQWMLDYTVPVGDPRIGQTLGFTISDTGTGGNGAFDSLDITFQAVPEPSSVILFLVGMAALGYHVCRRRNYNTH